MLPSAKKELDSLPRKIAEQVDARIRLLAFNPRPAGCKVLRGKWQGHLRIRSGNFRIVYRVEDDRLLVLVIKVGDRKDIYE